MFFVGVIGPFITPLLSVLLPLVMVFTIQTQQGALPHSPGVQSVNTVNHVVLTVAAYDDSIVACKHKSLFYFDYSDTGISLPDHVAHYIFSFFSHFILFSGNKAPPVLS